MTQDAERAWSPVLQGGGGILERRNERLDAARLAGRPGWRRRYALVNAGLDAVAAVAAGAVADLTTLTITQGSAEDIGVPMLVSVVAFVALWLAVQAVGGTYDDTTSPSAPRSTGG